MYPLFTENADTNTFLLYFLNEFKGPVQDHDQNHSGGSLYENIILS